MRNSRRGEVDPFIVMEVMEASAAAEQEGRHIIHMEVGQPSSPAPAAARDALAQALKEEDPLGYTVTPGLPALRQGIAELYGKWYGIDLDPGRIIITPGSSGAFLLAFIALFDAGQRVAMGRPGYPSYRQIIRALDLEAIEIETGEENRFQPVPDDLKDLDFDGLMIASPGNPTGTMLGRDEMAGLIDATHAKGASFLSDEIYHGLHFEGRSVSALEIDDDVVVINSFSKYFSMTGWRVGWLVLPEENVKQVERLAQNMFICAPHAAQVAALGALSGFDELEGHHAVYARNRQLMMEGLPQAGFDRIAPPDGAFYIYADVSHLTDDSRAFARQILDEAGVAVTPGLDFDPIRGHHTLRFSYAQNTEAIEEGLERLSTFMAKRR